MQLRKFTLKFNLFSLLCKITTLICFTGVYSHLDAWTKMGQQRSPRRGSWKSRRKPRIYVVTPFCYRYSHPVVFLRTERSFQADTISPRPALTDSDITSKGSSKKVYSQLEVHYLKPSCSHSKEYIAFVLITGLL